MWKKCVMNDFNKLRTLKKMHRNDISIVCRKNMAIKKTFCKLQLGEVVNSILKKVGLYLQNDSYLISNSPYTI